LTLWGLTPFVASQFDGITSKSPSLDYVIYLVSTMAGRST
jgi:hypothetical protein